MKERSTQNPAQSPSQPPAQSSTEDCRRFVDDAFLRAISELESRPVMPERPPGLEQTLLGLNALQGVVDLNIAPSRVILVAGTNGKGSVSASLEALLLSAGQKVGLYTSPHLLEITERIRINGQNLNRSEFLESYRIVSQATSHLPLTHFEILTLMAAERFFRKEESLDWVILEVGLGGKWDATNAIPHHWGIITRLGLDHQNLLGKNIVEIAKNKFGIIPDSSLRSQMKEAPKVIHAPFPEEVKALAEELHLADKVQWIEAPFEKMSLITESPEALKEPQFQIHTPWGKAPIGLAGERGAENSLIALTAFQALRFSPSEHLHALQSVQWPGRMQKVKFREAPCPVFVSGDHNPQGAKSLVSLLHHYPRKRLHILCGIGKEKDAKGILETLFQIEDAKVYLTETPFRGLSIEDYPPEYRKACTFAEKDFRKALSGVFNRAREGDMILVSGSLYLIGEVLRFSNSP